MPFPDPVAADATVALVGPPPLPPVARPRVVVLTDFDETYFAHDRAAPHVAARRALDEYLATQAEALGIVFGIVTGSAFSRLAELAEAGELFAVPHFVSSSLGTQMYFFDGAARAEADPAYHARMAAGGFSPARVAAFAEALRGEGLALTPQPPHTEGAFKRSFYWPCADTPENAARMAALVPRAQAAGLGINVSFCNPAVGDLAAGYDIDFIAAGAGKAAAAAHVLSRYGVAAADAFAFGESGNDLSMLRAVGHGYAVANATPEVRRAGLPMARGSYAAGIHEVLRAALAA